MAGITAICFICCVMAIFGFLIHCRLSKKREPIKQKDDILEQPRLRETIDEYMTQHLEENFGAYLHNLVKVKSSMDCHEEEEEELSEINEDEGVDPKQFLYVDANKGTTESYTQHVTPRGR